MGAGVRSSKLLARALTDPTIAGLLVQEVARDVAEASRAVSDVARAVARPGSRSLLDATVSLSSVVLPDTTPREPAVAEQTLRERGEALLQRSRDVWSDDEDTHPAYARILGDLARTRPASCSCCSVGVQPSVDVRTGGPVGMGELGPRRARHVDDRRPGPGCRYLDEVPAYLNNLFRLGLIWFSREQIEDPMECQVVEAQPDPVPMHSVRFPKVVRRSIHHSLRRRLLQGLPGRPRGDRRAACCQIPEE